MKPDELKAIRERADRVELEHADREAQCIAGPLLDDVLALLDYIERLEGMLVSERAGPPTGNKKIDDAFTKKARAEIEKELSEDKQ